MAPFFPIRNLEEIKKVLFIQKSVTEQANRELFVLAVHSGEPERFIPAAKRLLDKYTKYPTLSEFAADPHLADVYKWGATFGVAGLVNNLIIFEVAMQAKPLRPDSESVLRGLYMLLLKELDHPEHKYLVEPLEKALTAKSDPKALRQMVTELIESFALVSVPFGIMVFKDAKLSLTFMGKRVLLHLADTQRFIEKMAAAHKKFQAPTPVLPPHGERKTPARNQSH